MSISAVVNQLASGVRSATQTGAEQTNMEAVGLTAYLNVSAVPGVDTVLLRLEEKDPLSGVWFTVTQTLAQAATGLIVLNCIPDIAPIAASVSIVTISDRLPHRWRLSVVHSAGTNFTYSLSYVLHT
jgi:hypothetical protein